MITYKSWRGIKRSALVRKTQQSDEFHASCSGNRDDFAVFAGLCTSIYIYRFIFWFLASFFRLERGRLYQGG